MAHATKPTNEPATGSSARFVLGLTGYTCSGKTELAKLLERRGFARIDLGEFTREVARSRGIPQTRTETWALFRALVATSPTWRVPLVREALGRTPSSLVVLDGVRSKEEAEAFREELGGSYLLFEVRTDETIRIERAMRRRRDVDPVVWDETTVARWKAMDAEEVAMIDRLRPLVDVTIVGGGGE